MSFVSSNSFQRSIAQRVHEQPRPPALLTEKKKKSPLFSDVRWNLLWGWKRRMGVGVDEGRSVCRGLPRLVSRGKSGRALSAP